MSKCIYRSLPEKGKAAEKGGSFLRLVDEREVPSTLKNFADGKKYFIRTYGCQGNVRDEEIMAGYLEKAGFSRTLEENEADLALINTCAVRENAEEKIYGEIGKFKANKEKNPSFLLVLAGCVMGEEGVAKKLEETYPYISLIIGTHDVSNILVLLNEVLEKKKNIVDVRSFAGEIVENMPSTRLSSFEAYVNISYGCDKFCTYCIVPYTRGRERSRLQKDVVKECQKLVDEGYKQITLLGQNVNSYGLDLHDGTSFAGLLEEVAKLGIPRLRFLTSYPSQFTSEMIDVMAKYPSIVHWLHFPVQSGSTSCLKRMGRRYDRETYLSLVKEIKEKIPDIALTSDIIVGFPLESEEEFEDTLSLCEEVSYSSAFTFIYSPRIGTPAAKMPQLDEKVTHERFDRLKKVIEDSTSKHSEGMVGKTFEVLVEGPSKKDDKVLSGYARNGKLINFEGPSYLTGALVDVKVTESKTYSLRGELVGDPLIWKAKDVSFLLQHDPLLKEYLSLDEAIRKDESVAKLGESLVEIKKRMCLDVMDVEKYKQDKKEYEDCLLAIKNNPLLSNRDALLNDVEERLLEVRDLLR
ncbi:MAG: tRNA (N6-isopentenyl adenosine(37)-C2)-methylthiotransferase MiaB [Bacilli bacterium]|jgi:tRNA-2-methylthio-N6-dimethylallyladenosine synthase|nr:tRNA (N6-isopentenyl adenosine(37)-C2)-methylthiotransferase MiaB [Bacilli bacterium]MCH4228572.1 tRNA (N6-isopentenyl adenosine(37)-C2)-methylthiotransferase MiaB [Bacilli bacterium]MCH4277900.1 tRNA (N6-isopentenyl adenosine(37)-C2)-methylthiotransferase MiaB [Bacilli bacterium]MCI2055248.1 tRNA (N6-isopentenyl adenosine(37)-C2)-methylthiotransferase MiaB [Bacilli bacterium]